jgi:hypothetical protein
MPQKRGFGKVRLSLRLLESLDVLRGKKRAARIKPNRKGAPCAQARRPKDIIVIAMNAGKMRTKGEQRRRK